MIRNSKFLSGFLAIGIITIILTLAMGLDQLILSPGYWPKPISSGKNSLTLSGSAPNIYMLFLRGFLVIASLIIPVFLYYAIIIKKECKGLIVFVICTLVIFGVIKLIIPPSQNSTIQPLPGSDVSQPAMPDLDIRTSIIPTPPDWMTIVISLGIATCIVLTVLYIIWIFRNRNQQNKKHPATVIVQQAQLSINDIYSGKDFREIIITCYISMNRAAFEYTKLLRDDGMTPHEFIHLLAANGFPENEVRSLTLLFEAVRYGNALPGKEQERQAIDCLNAIASAVTKL